MNQKIRIRALLILSALLMIVGHCFVIASGVIFGNPASGQHYNVFTNWVSDFAAKWPEGLWIKFSIALFCLALADFVRVVIKHFSGHSFARLLKFWWLLLATAMIGGLILVVLFDMSPSQYQWHDPSWLAGIFGAKGGYEPVSRTTIEWLMRGHHQFGFSLFVTGFFLSAISLAWSELRSGLRDAIPATIWLLMLASVSVGWLFFYAISFPGIPQRLLIAVMFVWLWRNLSTVTATSFHKQES